VEVGFDKTYNGKIPKRSLFEGKFGLFVNTGLGEGLGNAFVFICVCGQPTGWLQFQPALRFKAGTDV